jgi:hypothetical protein
LLRLLASFARQSTINEDAMKRKTLIVIVLLLTWGTLNGSDKPLIAQTVATVTPQPATATAIPDDKPRLIFIAIDSLNPTYLDMDPKASGKGAEDNWLMPNVRSFLMEATFWSNARAHLPYATDMNHLNILYRCQFRTHRCDRGVPASGRLGPKWCRPG